MDRIWWSWDIRMRWSYGFSGNAESYVKNYCRAIDAAGKYGVRAIVIWGFLRDRHGGTDAAHRIRDYAGEKGIAILPGVGIDAYGGVYYQGAHKYSLDTYIQAHPECQARDKDGTPSATRWPSSDTDARRKACPSDEKSILFYRESLEWLIDTFALDGFQIEQGDTGLCYCERCRDRPRIVASEGGGVSLSDSACRIESVLEPILSKHRRLTVLSETYLGLTRQSLESIGPVLGHYPNDIILSWQLYDAPGRFKIEPGIHSPRAHGCAAIRTNNDLYGGELDDAENVARALQLSKAAGLNVTYIYGEYPDDWPCTRRNYEVWAAQSQ